MNRHISEQYEAELAQLHDLLMEMGGIVERQVDNACMALIEHDQVLAESVKEDENKINELEVELDDLCVAIIARRQPTAGDLRRVVSVMKMIVDLERIGDEAERIANMALRLVGNEKPPHQYAGFRVIHSAVGDSLRSTLDAFARQDVDQALTAIRADKTVDASYKELIAVCTEDLRGNAAEVDNILCVMWAARSLERIGDHAKNISEYIIYQVIGEDVRHSSAKRRQIAQSD